MNPVFIYQNEADFKNNKFSIDFNDDENRYVVDFSTDKKYYFCTLNAIIEKDFEKISTLNKTNFITSLSTKSNELLTKGSNHQNDIDQITTEVNDIFNIPELDSQNYKLYLNDEIIKENSYEYEFFDDKTKKFKKAAIYSPFSHFIKGFIFKGETSATSNNTIVIRLDAQTQKIITSFLVDEKLKDKITNRLYRDANSKFVLKQGSTSKQWFMLTPSLHLRALEYQLIYNDIDFHADKFYKFLFYDERFHDEFQKKFKVIGTKISLIFRGQEQPFIINNDHSQIVRNWDFLIPAFNDGTKTPFTNSILKDCTFLGKYNLDDEDKRQIEKYYPNFCFKNLFKVVSRSKKGNRTQFDEDNIFFIGDKRSNIFDFKKNLVTVKNSNNKYKDFLKSNGDIFFKTSVIDLPKTLDKTEEIFDEKVLEIKKLVKDIGKVNFDNIEQLNLSLYDRSNLIKETYFQRLNKHIQIYGITILKRKDEGRILTIKNSILFKTNRNVFKNELLFDLSYLEDEKIVKTIDDKIHNISILVIEKEKEMEKIEKEIEIFGFQSFDKFKKLNPVDTKITDIEVRNKLIWKENRKIKYRFSPRSIFFSAQIINETEVIFLAVNGLNEARDVSLNGKFFKCIGIIFTNEIDQ